ncbi:efflux RND transporter periplasmic adaptor subunit [Larkinella rosea]|nr:efflux RND transporter periplasmic adaptor subunit [Larkinella rosea]
MRKITLGLLLMICGTACQKEKPVAVTIQKPNSRPVVQDSGRLIEVGPDSSTIRFFQTETVQNRSLTADYQAPAHVVATVIGSGESDGKPMVLFDNPALTDNYSQLQQHLTNIRQLQDVNIKQKLIELGRAKDLAEHGAATGREVLEAQSALAMERTNLANERALLAQHETTLKLAGFDPIGLQHARPGQAWLICDVPESQVNKLQVGNNATIRFTAYPDETVSGRIESFGDVVDNVTRTIKLRIRLDNPAGKFRAGMFATVSFGISEGQFMSLPQTALVTVQGKDYVFIKSAPRRFERREVTLGQQIGDRIVVFHGLKETEAVVIKGTMQLKGLSFGY